MIVSAVGIATMGPRKPDDPRGPNDSTAIREAMELAVLNSVQQGEADPAKVKARIMEARGRAKRDG